MATNIEMNILKSDGSYEVLYPKTLGSLVDGKVSSASTADSATSASTATSATNATYASQLSTSRNLRVSLSSTSSQGFDGSGNATSIGVNGTLPVSNGGTGSTSASSVIYNIVSALSSRSASNLNSYADYTYIPCYYGSTGYQFALSSIMTYINNNVGSSSSSGSITANGSTRTGNGSNSFTVSAASGLFLAITYPSVFNSSSSYSTWGLAFCCKGAGSLICSVNGVLRQGGYCSLSENSFGCNSLTSNGITAINASGSYYDWIYFCA